MNKVALILFSNSDFGGAERRLVRIYNELGKENECDIIVRGSDYDGFYKRLKKADCDVSNIHKIITFKSNFLCLLYLIICRKYKAIHFFDMCGFNIAIAKIMRIFSTRTLLTVAFQNYAYGLIDENTKRSLVRLLDLSNRVDVLFPAGLEYFQSISSNNAITVTPGTFTNIDLFQSAKKERLILFAAARLEKDKNAILLVEACYLCKDLLRKLKYEIYICGQGYEEAFLRNRIREYDIDDIIKMPGYVKISDIMPKAEIFACLDLVDNYPSQTIAEATACGCFLIITDVGYSRLCGEGDFAEYVANDSRALADRIECFISATTEEKNKVKDCSRKYAETHYSIKTSADYFRRLLWD